MPTPRSEPIRVVVAGEDRTHQFLLARLIRSLPGTQGWRLEGLDLQSDFYKISRAKADAKKAGIRTTGRVKGKPRSPEAVLFLRVRLLAQEAGATGVVVLRDSDNDEGLLGDAARLNEEGIDWQPYAAFGVAHRDAEGWLLAGYTAQGDDERIRLQQAKKWLSFNPTREPERLTAQPNDADTDAKRVLAFILGEGTELTGKGRAPSRPPTDDDLASMAAGLAGVNDLAAFENCGAAAFVAALRALASRLGAPTSP